ncbi:unnamed protein product [Oikopleura dioica]|uniref:EamA domain-containing protein n=1 Tax=Oikopleura dioica TaxID=34765 RepID=E4YA21_OIKDI|nr:unnamed protein product [Oikopleura dioica]
MSSKNGEEFEDSFMEKEENFIGMSDTPEEAKKKSHLLAISLVLGMALFNVAAEQSSKSLVTEYDFGAPVFIQYFSTSWMMICAFVYSCGVLLQNLKSGTRWNSELIPDLKPIGFEPGHSILFKLRFCLLFMLIYVGCNVLYVEALRFLPNTITSSIMAMDPAIVFVFSIFFLKNFQMGWRRNLLQIIAACLAVAGTVFFAIEGNNDFSENALSDTITGVLFVCGSVLLSSTYKVAFAKFFPSDLGIGQVSWLLGIIGLLNLLLIWPLVLGLSQPYPHVSISSSLDSLSVAGIEVIDVANVPWDFLALSAFLGLCFNLTLNFGVAYTYPLYMAIGQALVPPLNFVVDVIFRQIAFSTLQIVGSVVSVSAFLVVLIPVKSKKPTENVKDAEKRDDEIITSF